MAVDREVRIAGHDFALRDTEVVKRVRRLAPEPIASHYVVVARRRYPPKQVISAMTGLDRADFTTHQARRTLMRLGFVVGRKGVGTAANAPAPPAEAASLADDLRAHVGEWVAVKDDSILHFADTPQELVRWLTSNGQAADSMFRVPEDDVAASGIAPA